MGFGGFSLKRALGITKAKQKVSRAIGIPLTKSGRQRKFGAALGGSIFGIAPIGKTEDYQANDDNVEEHIDNIEDDDIREESMIATRYKAAYPKYAKYRERAKSKQGIGSFSGAIEDYKRAWPYVVDVIKGIGENVFVAPVTNIYDLAPYIFDEDSINDTDSFVSEISDILLDTPSLEHGTLYDELLYHSDQARDNLEFYRKIWDYLKYHPGCLNTKINKTIFGDTRIKSPKIIRIVAVWEECGYARIENITERKRQIFLTNKAEEIDDELPIADVIVSLIDEDIPESNDT